MNVLLVAILILVIDISSDVYIPSLTLLPHYFSAGISLVQMTLSAYLMGLTVSALFYGALADMRGRRRTILIGLSVFILGSLLCYATVNIYLFILARALQGIGGGVGIAVGYACISDMYSGVKRAQIISKIGMIIAIAPAIGPILGGWIAALYGWKAIFIFIATLSIVLLAVLYIFFKETYNPPKDAASIKLMALAESYLSILTNKKFAMSTLIMGFTFANLWAKIAYTPFIYNSLGIAYDHYGIYVSIIVLSYMLGTLINQRVVAILGVPKSLFAGAIIAGSGDLFARVLVHKITHISLTAAWSWSSAGLALIIGNSIASAMEGNPKELNARASSLIFALQTISGAAGVQLCALIAGQVVDSVLTILVILSALAIVSSPLVIKGPKSA